MQKGKPARKYSQAARVHDIIRLIEARHGVAVEEMAEETGVDRRTIYRDLGAIQEAGYPIVSEWLNGRKVYRFLTRFKDIPPINFTLQELMTLYFLRSQCDFLQGTPFHDEMESIFRKVNSVLPPRYAAHMERIATCLHPPSPGEARLRQGSRTAEAFTRGPHLPVPGEVGVPREGEGENIRLPGGPIQPDLLQGGALSARFCP